MVPAATISAHSRSYSPGNHPPSGSGRGFVSAALEATHSISPCAARSRRAPPSRRCLRRLPHRSCTDDSCESLREPDKRIHFPRGSAAPRVAAFNGTRHAAPGASARRAHRRDLARRATDSTVACFIIRGRRHDDCQSRLSMHFKIHALDARECESLRPPGRTPVRRSSQRRLPPDRPDDHETSVPAPHTLFDDGLAGAVPVHDPARTRQAGPLPDRRQPGASSACSPPATSRGSNHRQSYLRLHAITLTEVTACRIPQAVIQRLEGASPRLHAQLLRKWHEGAQAGRRLHRRPPSGKRAPAARPAAAAAVARDSGHQVLLPAREDVGGHAGITTETASRAVAAFRREGLLQAIDRQGRHFRVDAAARSRWRAQ